MMVDLVPLRRALDDVTAAVSGQERRASCDSVTTESTPRLYHMSENTKLAGKVQLRHYH